MSLCFFSSVDRKLATHWHAHEMPSSRGGKGQIPPAIGSALKFSCKKNFGIIPVQLKKMFTRTIGLFSRDTCIFILCSICIHLKWVKSKSLAEFVLFWCNGSASKEIYNDNVLAISGATSLRQIRSIKEAQNMKKTT